MENVQTKKIEYPSTAQINFALSLVNKKIKEGLEAQEVTYDLLNSHLLAIKFKPSGAQQELTIIYSYAFNNFERNTSKAKINGLLDCKDEFIIQFIE